MKSKLPPQRSRDFLERMRLGEISKLLKALPPWRSCVWVDFRSRIYGVHKYQAANAEGVVIIAGSFIKFSLCLMWLMGV
jgi:hypothetical protein